MDLPIIIEKVIFRNDRGFTILAAALDPYNSTLYKPELEELLLKNIPSNKYNNFTVTIDMMDAHKKLDGVSCVCSGSFSKHPKFGPQFKADFLYPSAPSNNDSLRAFLQTLPNIKEVRSADIIKKFGFEETIRILNEEVERLTEINGITENRIPPIKEAWERSKGERELCMWLLQHNIQASIGRKVYSIWQHESLKILTENPYKITEIKGFGFLRADQIAHKILDNVPKDLRTTSCLKHILDENLHKNSNLCMPYSILKDSTLKMLKDGSEQNVPSKKFEEEEYKRLIPQCIKNNLNLFVAIKNLYEHDNGAYVYLKDIWEKEKFIASQIYHRRTVEENEENQNAESNRDEDEKQFSCSDKDIDDAEKDVNDFSHRPIILDDCQKMAVKSAFENKITVITGSAGTGKSMVCRCISHLAHEKDLSIRLMSPTGKASRVLSSKTGLTAETIHRSLKMKPDSEYPAEEIREDVIIIDEFSMVGIDTAFAIMYAMKQNLWCHIVMVGDPKQLPSVSPGKFLTDIIESNCANVIKLNTIYRQDENSFIPVLANDIALGKVTNIPLNATDIKWNNLPSPDIWDIDLRKVVKDFISSNNIDDLQIIAPMYKGVFGINKTNEIIQDFMADINGVKNNPFHRGFTTFYIGDRVIQTENDYQKSIFNGDIGEVIEAGRKAIDPNSDEKKDYVVVNFYGENLTYVGDEIEEIRLAWTISIHKFQGSQCLYVICILPNEASNMMSREIVYTAMTRAEKRLDIYGHMSVFRLAPTRSAIKKRYTNMNNMIKELRDNQKIFKILE